MILEEILTSKEIELLQDFESFYVNMETQVIEKFCDMSVDEIKKIIHRRYIQSITHRFGVDRENPRVEVKITEVAE